MSQTGLVIFILVIILGIWDLYCLVFRGDASTVSRWVLKATKLSPVFAFVLGCVVGHLFFNMCGKL